jgi:AcrR family transcriptional regulator
MVSQVQARDGRRQRNPRGQGGRLRAELIEAARRLLMTAEREQDVSIRAVTRAAGTSPQSFYLQFESLDELLYAVYAIEFDDLRKVIAAAAAQAGDPPAALLAVCNAYCHYAEQYPGRYRALTGVRGQLHPEWQGGPMPGAPAFVVLRDTVAAALAAVGSGADAFLATATLWASLHGIVTLRADRPAFAWPSLDDMIGSLVTQLLAAARLAV